MVKSQLLCHIIVQSVKDLPTEPREQSQKTLNLIAVTELEDYEPTLAKSGSLIKELQTKCSELLPADSSSEEPTMEEV